MKNEVFGKVFGMKVVRMRRACRKGFTLIEMMVVIVIIGILASVVSIKVYQHIRKARITKAKLQISTFIQAIKLFKMETSKLPEDLEGLVEKTEAHPEGLLPGIPKDPWENDYGFYLDDDHEYVVVSYGADGQEGGEGEDADIYSYEIEGESSTSSATESDLPKQPKPGR